MGSVIEIDFRLEWGQPVFVPEGLLDRVVLGPREGLKYLQEDLPIRSGHTYWNAVSACSSALLLRCDLAHARLCFIAACAECMMKMDQH